MISEELTFSRLDTAFARFLGERTTFDPIQKQAFENLVMFVSYEQSQGHSCIRLDDEGKALVLASGLAVSHPQNLHRYWFYENRLAMQIKAMIQLSRYKGAWTEDRCCP